MMLNKMIEYQNTITGEKKPMASEVVEIGIDLDKIQYEHESEMVSSK